VPIYLKLLYLLIACKLAYGLASAAGETKYAIAHMWGTVITLYMGHQDP